MQFKLNISENRKILTNDIRSPRTELGVLDLRSNKLQYNYSTGSLSAISP